MSLDRIFTSESPGHILRKVYNCRERKNFRPPNILKFPVKKIFHYSKLKKSFDFIQRNSDDPFLSFTNAAGTTAQTYFLHHSFSKCHPFQHSFLRFSTVPIPNLQLQLHNSHFTTAQIVISCTLKYALHKITNAKLVRLGVVKLLGSLQGVRC